MSWILVVSGEVSGDQRLEELISALRDCGVEDRFRGMSKSRGVEEIVERGDVSMMGLDRLFQVGWRLTRARRHLLAVARHDPPGCAILVDYGGFNLSLGVALRTLGIPVFYYIPPKIWAWGQWRLAKLRRAADLVGPVFAFSDRWYRAKGLTTIYHGHPACDRFRNRPDKSAARAGLGIDESTRTLLIMPGSRPGELNRHLPVLGRTLRIPECKELLDLVCVPLVDTRHRALAEEAFAGAQVEVRYFPLATPELLAACDWAWIASGTANLEAAWSGLPALVFYRASPLTWIAGSRLVDLPWVSPVNLTADKEVYKELLQDNFSPQNLLQWQREIVTKSPVAILPQGEPESNRSTSTVISAIASDLSKWLYTV